MTTTRTAHRAPAFAPLSPRLEQLAGVLADSLPRCPGSATQPDPDDPSTSAWSGPCGSCGVIIRRMTDDDGSLFVHPPQPAAAPVAPWAPECQHPDTVVRRGNSGDGSAAYDFHVIECRDCGYEIGEPDE